MDSVNENSNFNITLLGDLQEIDASTFVDVIGNLLVGIYQINDEVRSNKGLKITIKEIKPAGSVGIFIWMKEALIDKLPLLKYITRDDIITVGVLISIIVGILSIRKFLMGEKPKEVTTTQNQTTIMNARGDIKIFDMRSYNIYADNQVVDTAFGRAFDVLKEDESINGIELYKEDGEKLFEASRDDFSFLSKPSIELDKNTKTKTDEVILKIFKIVFEKGYKWQFFYQGVKISADIKDEIFFQSIDKGTKFSKGDTLIVELQITQIYDKSVETYVNKDYIITKVIQHIPRMSQETIPINSIKQ